jgi:hypothetical protein
VALPLFEGKIRSLPRQILGQRAENAPFVVNLSKNGVENLSFRIFALKGHNYSPTSKLFPAVEDFHI